jgi:hypothetical protein
MAARCASVEAGMPRTHPGRQSPAGATRSPAVTLASDPLRVRMTREPAMTARLREHFPDAGGRPVRYSIPDVLWFNRAVKRDPAIDMWLNEQAPELGLIARNWFFQMRQCGEDVRELMHDGCPVACVGDVPFGYVNVFKAHVNVGFFLGAELDHPTGLLQGTGRRMRHVKVQPEAPFEEAALSALIRAAYVDMKSRLISD